MGSRVVALFCLLFLIPHTYVPRDRSYPGPIARS